MFWSLTSRARLQTCSPEATIENRLGSSMLPAGCMASSSMLWNDPVRQSSLPSPRPMARMWLRKLTYRRSPSTVTAGTAALSMLVRHWLSSSGVMPASIESEMRNCHAGSISRARSGPGGSVCAAELAEVALAWSSPSKRRSISPAGPVRPAIVTFSSR